MGWLYMPREAMGGHDTPKSYLDAQFTYERLTDDGDRRRLAVLASSCPQNRVYYAAVEESRTHVRGDVFAIVCLVRWNPRDREGLVFGYKAMDETCGPCEAACPERVLRLLTPTENDHALAWRRRCEENLARRRRPLEDGMRVRLSSALTFCDGHVGADFVVEKSGRSLSLRSPETGRAYRISRFMDRDWSVAPWTRVHQTVFD